VAARRPDHGHRGRLQGPRGAGRAPRPAHGPGARPARWRLSGGAGWRKRIWRCREPACGVGTWTERAAPIRPRAVLTQRARAQAWRRVGKDAYAVAAVARDPRRWLGDRAAGGGDGGDHGTPRWTTLLVWRGWRPSAWTRRAFLRTAQVAELLHVSPKTVSRWAQEGRLPYLRTLGGHRRYPDAEIRALLEALSEPSAADQPPGASL
jgi:excisionase family DNA binding protein